MLVDTFTDFCVAADDYRLNYAPGPWRTGQTAMNLLMSVRPDLHEIIRGSAFDCFEEDANLLAFYSFLARHWDD